MGDPRLQQRCHETGVKGHPEGGSQVTDSLSKGPAGAGAESTPDSQRGGGRDQWGKGGGGIRPLPPHSLSAPLPLRRRGLRHLQDAEPTTRFQAQPSGGQDKLSQSSGQARLVLPKPVTC